MSLAIRFLSCLRRSDSRVLIDELAKTLSKVRHPCMRLRSLLFLGLAIWLTPPAFALRGVIDDPDGFTYVRAGKSQDSAIVARVKTGEVFDFEVEDQIQHPSEWRKVKLASGKEG